MSPQSSLAKEQIFFEQNKRNYLRKYRYKFVLIKNKELIGVYENAEEAYADGLKKLGNKPMFIKQVVREEPTPLVMALQ